MTTLEYMKVNKPWMFKKILIVGQGKRVRRANVVATGEVVSRVCKTSLDQSKQILSKWGHDVTMVSTLDKALALLEKESFDWVISDVWLPVKAAQAKELSEMLCREVGEPRTVNFRYSDGSTEPKHLPGRKITTSLAKHFGGLLLEKILEKKHIQGIFLDTNAVTEGVLFMLAAGLQPVRKEISKELEAIKRDYVYAALGNSWFYHWIDNCADDATAISKFHFEGKCRCIERRAVNVIRRRPKPLPA